MKTKLTTAILLAVSVNISYAGENCLPSDAGSKPPMEIFTCFQRVLDAQQKQIEELTTENQAFEEKFTLMDILHQGGKKTISFVDAKGITRILKFDGNKPVQNEWIAYRPGNDKKDATLYFNLNGSPSAACTLLHNDDDKPRPGLYFATSADNDFKAIWGSKTEEVPTFVLSRKGVASYPVAAYATYTILCVK